MSDHTIDHGLTRLELEWDIDRDSDPKVGIYVLINDEHALVDIAVTVDVRGKDDQVVKSISETEATACIRLSLDEAKATRDALTKVIAEAEAHHCEQCGAPDGH